MSKTIPIWACVINRAVADMREELDAEDENSLDWDCQLHLPIWVSEVEKNNIENLIDSWVEDLKACGAHLAPVARSLRKPLRTLWVSQKTVIWINEVVEIETLNFTPIFLVSASQPVSCTQRMTDAEFSWSYIPGAADDEESWARGLTPTLFWKHVDGLVNDSPVDCNRKVADIVERDRVYRSLRGQEAAQVRVKSSRKLDHPVDRTSDASSASSFLIMDSGARTMIDSLCSDDGCQEMETSPPDMLPGLHWIGSTGLAVGDSSCCQGSSLREVVDCVLDVDSSACSISEDAYLQLPVVGSKFDRHSLQDHLPIAVKFAMEKLAKGLSLLVCCSDGEDLSVCVCLAILLSCFDSRGEFCSTGLKPRTVSKADVRQSLVQLASYHSGARPSRGSLKQVYNYLQSHNS